MWAWCGACEAKRSDVSIRMPRGPGCTMLLHVCTEPLEGRSDLNNTFLACSARICKDGVQGPLPASTCLCRVSTGLYELSATPEPISTTAPILQTASHSRGANPVVILPLLVAMAWGGTLCAHRAFSSNPRLARPRVYVYTPQKRY